LAHCATDDAPWLEAEFVAPPAVAVNFSFLRCSSGREELLLCSAGPTKAIRYEVT
jgi:hypothetical protein